MKQGNKADAEKLRMDLIPTSALEGLARVLTFGAKKYGDRNWEKGLLWSRIYAAALRHLTAFWRGEDNDPESRLLHLEHALTCISFLVEYTKTKPGLDNRPSKMKWGHYVKGEKREKKDQRRRTNLRQTNDPNSRTRVATPQRNLLPKT